MPFQIIRQDITKLEVDAIVNPTSQEPSIGTGVDQAIFSAAGESLLEDRKLIGHIETTKAYITKGYNLLSKYVIHTVGPIYINGEFQEADQLKKTYNHVLNIAKDYNLESIAFPLISSGNFRFPRGQALEIALDSIKQFLEDHEMMIYLVVYDEASYQISLDKYNHIESYLNDEYKIFKSEDLIFNKMAFIADAAFNVDDVLNHLDETFVESLFRLIDDRELSDVEVYKKANIDRKLFSKIKSNMNYQPSKVTAIAFAIALELDIDETEELLAKAGFALSPSQPFDKIISFFIENESYDLYEINQTLFAFNQKTIGG